MQEFTRIHLRALTAGCAILALGACGTLDYDIRDTFGNAFDTSDAVRQKFAPRPEPDNRGVISYPGYQVVVARQGDTITDVANRISVDPASLSRYNAVAPEAVLREGEIIVLPERVAEPSPATGAIATGPIRPATDGIDVETIAGAAIDRAGADQPQASLPQTGREPVRHRTERGETAYSVARLYNVSVQALAEWNGLDSDLVIREGQYLLIPVAAETAPAAAADTVSGPGEGSPTPTPPSAATPLPEDDTTATARPEAPPSPSLSGQQTGSSRSRLLFPVNGNIIRPYEKGGNSGIDIAAPVGATVSAAGDGTVAAITQDTENVPVLVIRHADNLLTVYANIANIVVERGQTVTRGRKIAEVRSSTPPFIRFEVRRGFDAIDPMPLLQSR